MSILDCTPSRPLWRVAHALVAQQPSLGPRIRRALRLLDTLSFEQSADAITFADGAIVRLPNCACNAPACASRPLCDHECAAFLIRRADDEDLRAPFLSAREQQVLDWRTLHGDTPRFTLQQIGKELGISRERVRQIEQRARRKLSAS